MLVRATDDSLWYINVPETKEHSQLEQKHRKERGESRTLELMIDMALGMLICILLKDLAESLSSTTASAKRGAYAFLHWTYPGSVGNAVAPMHLKSVQPCLEEHGNYCINGNCIFHTELRMPTCRCLTGYSGERCENMMLSSYTQYTYEGYIAVGIGAAMLLTGIFAVIYCYIRKRYKETKPSYKAYHVETAL